MGGAANGLVDIFRRALCRYSPVDLHNCNLLNVWQSRSLCLCPERQNAPFCRPGRARCRLNPAESNKQALLARSLLWLASTSWTGHKVNIDPPRCQTCSLVACASAWGSLRFAESRWCYYSKEEKTKQNPTLLQKGIVLTFFFYNTKPAPPTSLPGQGSADFPALSEVRLFPYL